MGATLRILPNGSFNLSPDGLEEFPSESAVVSEAASETGPDALDDTVTALVLTETVPAYAPPDTRPSSSALVSHGTYRLRPDSTPRPHIVSSVTRAVRAVLLAPIWAASFVLLRLSWLARWAVYGVWQAVTGGVRLVISGIWSLITGIWSLITGTCRLVVASVRAVGRGILAVVMGAWNAIRSAGVAVVAFARAVVQAIASAIVNTIVFIARAIAALVRAVVFGIWRVVLGICLGIWTVVAGAAGLVVAAVHAVGRGVSAAIAFVWRTIAAFGAAVARFVRAVVQGISNGIVFIARAIAALARAIVFGIWRVVLGSWLGIWSAVTGAAGLVAASVHAVRRAVATAALFVWRTIAAGGTAIAGFPRAVAQGIADAIARTIGFACAVLAATGRGVRAVVVSTATLLLSTVAFLAGAIAAIVWALVLGLWTVLKGTARLLGAGVRGVPAAMTFAGRAIVVYGAGMVALARAAGRDVHASFARTSALIQRGSDATAARYVTGLHAIGRNLSVSLAAGASAASRGVASVTALTGTPGQAALVDADAARMTIADAAPVAGRGSTSLFWRLYEGAVYAASRVLHDGAVARVALAGMPLRARHGLMAPAMTVTLGATLAATTGALLTSWHPAAPAVPAAPAAAVAVSPIPPAAAAALGPAITRGSAPRAGRNPATARTESSSPIALPLSGGTGRIVNATQVQALWGKADTRSLDRALSAIRSATLAFQRCNLQMTSDDAAVAHCDEARVSDGQSSSRRRPVAWTIDFRRDDARWLIERISTSTTASNR